MQPYRTLRNENFIPHTSGGICPHCKKDTGWHVRRMGVIPNFQDVRWDPLPDEIQMKLVQHGYVRAKNTGIPGLLENTCMACKGQFYDYIYRLASPIPNGEGERGGGYDHIGLLRLHPIMFPANIPQPNIDLPASCREIFLEAAQIFTPSHRAAAVLLRLCLQQLLEHLGYKGSINEMIKEAVKRGVPGHIQQFMDIVRYRGNDAAHSRGLELNPEELRENAAYMFDVINTVAEHLITYPRQALDNYNKLPESIRSQIANRDAHAN